jgi:histidine triad (HIT) family protein
VLVVPTDHVVTLPELVDVGPFFERVQLVAAAVPTALGAQGTFVAQNNVVSQSVRHLHVHVVPRTKGDGLRGFFWPRTRYQQGQAEAVAERLRATLAAMGGAHRSRT